MRGISFTNQFILVIASVTMVVLAAAACERREETVEEAAPPETVYSWIDEIVVLQETDTSSAIARLAAGDFDMYAGGVSSPDILEEIQAQGLAFEESFGRSTELTFNPSGPEFEGTGELNPFSEPRIREAMNLLVDRDYIAEEIYGGLAKPRYHPISGAFPDYARVAGEARALEMEYAYDPQRAEEIISEQMERLGAERKDGVWRYEDEPVELIFVIRTEDERREVGDYVANRLEDIGFKVDRLYRTADEASALWIGSHPSEGRFHLYTGGWIATLVNRDQAAAFDFYYTPRSLPQPLYQAYEPSPEFDAHSQRLAQREYSTLAERNELFAEALRLALQDSARVWLVDQVVAKPRQPSVSVAADLGGGVSGARLWALTLQKDGGGEFRLGTPGILTEPWNPLDGSNWVYDQMIIRATSDEGTKRDPFTGLPWPQRIESAEVTVQDGLPVTRTHDWVTLEFAERIEVPEDAWAGWDPVAQEFTTVGEEHPEGMTARRRSIVTYPEDFFEIMWHDGSQISTADIVLGIILTFDRAKEESTLFDAAQLPGYESFIRNFRGIRITSENPLTIEYYADNYFLDAEANVSTFFPTYAHGAGAWHQLALGIRAEINEQLAFSADKADRLEVEWASYVGGPSLKILAEELERAQAENYLPYEPVLAEYVDDNEVAERWENLAAWYERMDHLWVGIGPFKLTGVRPVEGTVVLERFEHFPDPFEKWERFDEPAIAQVDIHGPSSVVPGEEAVFEIEVSYDGRPYDADDIDTVQYLVFDATGALQYITGAEHTGDGIYRAILDAELTNELQTGATRIEAVVVPLIVSIPTFESREFVVIP